MALPVIPASSISLNQVNVELNRAGTTTISLNDSIVRTLFGKSSGIISMSDGSGKSNRKTASFSFTVSLPNATVNISTLSGYVAGSTDVTLTVNSGIYLYGTTIGTPGLTISGATTGDTVTLINNGFILGKGGDGAVFNSNNEIAIAAQTGSTALSISCPTTITNTSGYIAGGGGAGGEASYQACAGGGAGGGAGGYTQTTGVAGGVGGGIGSAGTSGQDNSFSWATGGGGGRIVPGTGGSGQTLNMPDGNYDAASGFGGGAGGGGGIYATAGSPYFTYSAGGGGGWGASGGAGTYTYDFAYGTSGSGGSAGNAGGNGVGGNGTTTTSTVVGTAGGKAVALNGFSVTWTGGTSSSSRAYGAVS